MADVIYMTKERMREIEEQLHELKTKGRKEIAQKIADARSHGDLSENAEYDAAKDAQGLLESKIGQLSNMLIKAQVISPDELPNDKVYILSKVKIKNMKTNAELEYTMVSPEEADFEKKKLSVDSPIGKELMGKVIGDVVDIKAPAGKMQFQILDISK